MSMHFTTEAITGQGVYKAADGSNQLENRVTNNTLAVDCGSCKRTKAFKAAHAAMVEEKVTALMGPDPDAARADIDAHMSELFDMNVHVTTIPNAAKSESSANPIPAIGTTVDTPTGRGIIESRYSDGTANVISPDGSGMSLGVFPADKIILVALAARESEEAAVRAAYRADMITELFERALCLGYDDMAAARVADCFENFDMISDPCPTHPNHSLTTRTGYAVDGCEACNVITKSNAEGWFPGKWDLIKAERHAEYVEIMNRDIHAAQLAGECACGLIMEFGAANLPDGGTACLSCGSVFTREGADASAAVLAVSAMVVEGNQSGTVRPESCREQSCGECRDCLTMIMSGELVMPTTEEAALIPPAINGFRWTRHNGHNSVELSEANPADTFTWQLRRVGSGQSVSATITHVKDNLWRANGCHFISRHLTPGWDGESLTECFARVVTYAAEIIAFKARVATGWKPTSADRMSVGQWAHAGATLDNPFTTVAYGDVLHSKRTGATGEVTDMGPYGLRVVFRDGTVRQAQWADFAADGFEHFPAEVYADIVASAGRKPSVNELIALGGIRQVAPGRWVVDDAVPTADGTTIKPTIRAALGRRKRKASKVNARRVKGGF